MEERGIKVLSCTLENIDGLMARVRRAGKSAVPVLVVNDSHWGERQRLTIAHELGHMVLEIGAKVDDEKAAYRFAGAFLMPAEVLWATIGKHRTSIGWSETFCPQGTIRRERSGPDLSMQGSRYLRPNPVPATI